MSSYEEKGTINENFKVLIIGARNTGKTTILHKFLRSRISWPHYPTLGFEYHPYIWVHKPTNQTIRLQVWDTSGQNKYRQIILHHFQRVHGALVFFDLSDKNSFNELDNWYRDLRRVCGNYCAIILVGNKSDLPREISIQEAIDWAKKKNMYYLETSSMWDPLKEDDRLVGAITLFEKLITLVMEKHCKEVKTKISYHPQPRDSCFC
ncbi:unnamed protein product [Blepharisma stoltei]|uniref:Uncharacterized protein n=1 Tax=Blepharisma stoltei TaxID=1481888 RepID=A0AAU9K0J8_9CILI|nr:unnamed protein product [Blepharisma stoltei]